MTLSLNNLKPSKGGYKKKKRVGRGNSSGHGTYSCRGMKGQRSRSGGKGGLKLKGMKRNIQQIPKKKGFTSLRAKSEVVNIEALGEHFADGAVVNPKSLQEKGLIGKITGKVKILGKGELNKKLTIKDCSLSKSAEEAIKKAGGTV